MDMEKALLDPAGTFSRPAAVCEEPTLTHDQKIEILRRWEHDARELAVAEDENMAGGESDLLAQVLAALRELETKA